MTVTLSKHHQHTYDAIFQHPIAHDLHWRDVEAMLTALTQVSQEQNGNVKVVRNGQTLVLRASAIKSVVAMDELMAIRHFLERSGVPTADALDEAGNFLVVIDHREARIYKAELHGSIPQRITPYDPHGFGRNLHYVQEDASGQRKPESKSFYEAIAKTLRKATHILVFGSGTGSSSAMEMLLAVLQVNHAEVSKCVVGSMVLDAQHMTDDQLLAKARDFYEARERELTEAKGAVV